mmetsp:Transcript_13488/g.24797  ORF Transcript_13488/g.24797 Transcript_13488/m.24797 type:complete len:106 (-) Transcript_13488:2-319(-)
MKRLTTAHFASENSIFSAGVITVGFVACSTVAHAAPSRQVVGPARRGRVVLAYHGSVMTLRTAQSLSRRCVCGSTNAMPVSSRGLAESLPVARRTATLATPKSDL